SATCSTRSSAATRPSATSPIRSRSCSAQNVSVRGPRTPRTSATRRSTCAPQKLPGWRRSRSRGGASTTACGSNARSRTRSSTRRRSCLPHSDPAARAAELRELLSRALIAYHVDDDPIMEDALYDALYDELVALEAEHPELVTPDS